MTRPKVACCKLRSAPGAGRSHYFHGDDCLLLPGREIKPLRHPTHPAGSAIWEHGPGCLCRDHVYMELNLDRDDDATVEEIDA